MEHSNMKRGTATAPWHAMASDEVTGKLGSSKDGLGEGQARERLAKIGSNSLETGDRVAADARLLSGDNLRVDESALTGESQPVGKEPGTMDEDTPMADRRNPDEFIVDRRMLLRMLLLTPSGRRSSGPPGSPGWTGV